MQTSNSTNTNSILKLAEELNPGTSIVDENPKIIDEKKAAEFQSLYDLSEEDIQKLHAQDPEAQTPLSEEAKAARSERARAQDCDNSESSQKNSALNNIVQTEQTLNLKSNQAPNKQNLIDELETVNQINSDSGINEDVNNKDTEYENKFFGEIYKKAKPLVDSLNENANPIKISSMGAFTHIGTSFVEQSSAPEPLKEILSKISKFFSQGITHLPTTITFLEDLAKNDFMQAFVKVFTFSKFKFKNVSNFGFATGLAPGLFYMRKKFDPELIKNKKYTGLIDNLKFYFEQSKKVISKNLEEIKSGHSKAHIKAIEIFTPVVSIGTGIIGVLFVNNEVSTAKAKIIGFFRDVSGITGDLCLLNDAVEEETEKLGRKPKFLEIIKNPKAVVASVFMTSVSAGFLNRFNKPEFIEPVAQVLLGINEITGTALNVMANNLNKNDKNK